LLARQRFYKKAAAFVLRAVAKHSPELAQAVVDAGSLEALVLCLEEFDPSVKEAAAWALGYIASHTAALAQAVVDAGTLPLLVLCLQEPEISLKRITASALNDIAKHSPELAQAVVDAGAVAYLSPLIAHDDSKLKRQVCSALAQVAKHSVDMAEVVVGQLRKIGVRATLDSVSQPAFHAKQTDGVVNALITGWSAGGGPDVARTLNFFFEPGSLDYLRDEKLHALSDVGLTVVDETKRKAAVREVMDRVTDMAYIMPVAPIPVVFLHSSSVRIAPQKSYDVFGVGLHNLNWK
jgi:hypothetical protein